MLSNGTKNSLPKVIYIMGTARSGSTILEILLSMGKDTFGAGELTSLIKDAFIEDKLCSCHHSVSKCKIWSEVIEQVGCNEAELDDWKNLQKGIDWHDGFFRQLFGLVSKKDLQRYDELNHLLLTTIQRVTKCNVVLDSSKYAGRALALRRIMKANLFVICLTRSPAGLVNSFQKQNKDEQLPKSLSGTLCYYLLTLGSLRIADWVIGRQVLHVCFEDFIVDPQEALENIEAFCGVDLLVTKQMVEENKSFSVGHLVTGNRLRRDGTVRLDISPQHESVVITKVGKVTVKAMELWRRVLRF